MGTGKINKLRPNRFYRCEKLRANNLNFHPYPIRHTSLDDTLEIITSERYQQEFIGGNPGKHVFWDIPTAPEMAAFIIEQKYSINPDLSFLTGTFAVYHKKDEEVVMSFINLSSKQIIDMYENHVTLVNNSLYKISEEFKQEHVNKSFQPVILGKAGERYGIRNIENEYKRHSSISQNYISKYDGQTTTTKRGSDFYPEHVLEKIIQKRHNANIPNPLDYFGNNWFAVDLLGHGLAIDFAYKIQNWGIDSINIYTLEPEVLDELPDNGAYICPISICMKGLSAYHIGIDIYANEIKGQSFGTTFPIYLGMMHPEII
ncbi:MAG: hypothetical protein KKF44_08805 [Nanoarchaeota archaeon]|nr:hypothetical protein [Nanoarchaeota archaeon]